MLKHHLTYHHDSARLFARIAHEPWAMLLDSAQQINPATGKPAGEYGHYDILVARPMATLVTVGSETTITHVDNQTAESTISSQENPFALLKNTLKQILNARINASEMPKNSLPFTGGALGYFGYDLARYFTQFSSQPNQDAIPDMMVGIYDWAIVVDHRTQEAVLVSNGLAASSTENWAQLCDFFTQDFVPKPTEFKAESAPEINFTKATYANAFNQVQQYITAGDCYQVNLAQRFSAKVQGDSWVAYQHLRQISPAPFMAFMQLPYHKKNHKNKQFQVLSASPERFIQVVGDHVETRPIKGTRPRFLDALRDEHSANELLTSDKDKAENVMIVDLLRNDLGKVCQTGSVKVTKLFQLQSFANVHHLVSIVVGKLKAKLHSVDVLAACFPGGSITGAPKLRAMQIIDELEPNARELYCGTIGYIGFDGKMDTNIAIRTATCKENELIFYAGGGIVTDSNIDKEYAETLDKAAGFTNLMKHF